MRKAAVCPPPPSAVLQKRADQSLAELGNPVLLHDMEYRLLAHSQNVVSDDPIWQEFVTTGTVNLERILFYRDESFLDEAANATHCVLLRSDKLPYDRIYGKLFNGAGQQIGCACVTASTRPFRPGDFAAFEAFCDRVGADIAGDAAFAAYGQAYQELLMVRLIAGKISDKSVFTAHVESLYIGLADNLWLAVVQPPAHGEDAAALGELVRARHPDFKTAVYPPHLLVLFSAKTALDTAGLEALLDGLPGRWGVSGSFDNLFDLAARYDQALGALESGGDGRNITCV